MPLIQVISYAVAAVIALFTANQALQSNGIVFLHTLPAFKPFVEELFPIFYKHDNEPPASTPTWSSIPFIAEDSILTASTVSPEAPSLTPSQTLNETVQVDTPAPQDEGLKNIASPTQGIMTSDMLDESHYSENDKRPVDGCSGLCRFLLRRRALLILYTSLSRQWNYFIWRHLENIIDFRTQAVMAIGVFISSFCVVTILISAMTTSSGSLPRVPIDVSLREYTTNDVYALLQEQAVDIDLQIAMAEIVRLRHHKTRLTAAYNNVQGDLRVKVQEASHQESALKASSAALTIKTEEYNSAKKHIKDLHQNNKSLKSEIDNFSKQLGEKAKESSATQKILTKVKNDAEDTKRALTKLQQTITNLQKHSANEKKKLESTQNDLSIEQRNLKALKQEKADMHKHSDEVTRELESTKIDLDSTKSSLGSLERENTLLNEKLIKLGTELDAKTEKLNDTNSTLCNVRQDNSRLQTNFGSAERELETMKERLHTTNGTLGDVQEDNDKLRKQKKESDEKSTCFTKTSTAIDKGDDSKSSDEDPEAKDSGKVKTSGPTKRRRKRRRAGIKAQGAEGPPAAGPLVAGSASRGDSPTRRPDIVW